MQVLCQKTTKGARISQTAIKDLGSVYRLSGSISLLAEPLAFHWCKREGVEDNALKEWKRSIFTIVDKRIQFYSQNTNLLPPKPKSSFRHLKQVIQEFHRKYVLFPADKAANNVVVVCRLHYVNTLKQELDGTRAYLVLMRCL